MPPGIDSIRPKGTGAPPVINGLQKENGNAPKNNSKERPKISNTEWGLLIGFTLVVDIGEFCLDLLFEIGLVVNPFIDIAMGMALPFYFRIIKGLKFDTKRILTLIGGFVGSELETGADVIPLWTLDVLLMMALEKAEEKIPVVAAAAQKAAAVAGSAAAGGAAAGAGGSTAGASVAGGEVAAGAPGGGAAGGASHATEEAVPEEARTTQAENASTGKEEMPKSGEEEVGEDEENEAGNSGDK